MKDDYSDYPGKFTIDLTYEDLDALFRATLAFDKLGFEIKNSPFEKTAKKIIEKAMMEQPDWFD